MGDYDALYRVPGIAGTAFQLKTYKVSIAAVEPGSGTTTAPLNTKSVTIDFEGWIEAQEADAFAAAVLAIDASLRKARNFDVQVYGLGGELQYELLAAHTTAKPKVTKFDIKDSGQQLRKDVTFTVVSTIPPEPDGGGGGGGGGGDTKTTNSITYEFRPDGLRKITFAGEAWSSTDAYTAGRAATAAYEAAYPSDRWVRSAERIEADNSLNNHVKWSVSFEEFAGPLPLAGIAAGLDIVDGEVMERQDTDERGRILGTTRHNLLLDKTGDIQAILTKLRPTRQGQTILRSSYEYSTVREKRLTYEYSYVTSASGDGVLDFEQTLEAYNNVGEGQLDLTAYEFPGRKPVLAYAPQKAHRYVQRGKATGLYRFVRAPDPIYPRDRQEVEPRVTYSQANDVEKITEWVYTYIFDEAYPKQITPADLAKLARPAPGKAIFLDPPPATEAP